MSFEEEFDKIIKRKAEEEKYPFDQSNWDKTSILLDAERKTSRLLKLKSFYLPAVLALFIGSAGFFTYNYLSSKSTNTAVAMVNKSHLSSPKVITSEKSSTLKNEESTAIAATQKPNEQSTLTKSNLNTANNQPLSNTSAPSTRFVKYRALSETSKNNFTAKKDLLTNETVARKMPQSAATSDPLIEPATNTNSARQTILNSNVNQSPKALTEKPLGNSSLNDNAVQNDLLSESMFAEQTHQTSDSKIVMEETHLNADQLNAVFSTLPLEVEEMDLRMTPFQFLNRYDDDYYKVAELRKKHYMNVEFGANYLLGWNTKKGTDGQGFNWYGGFNYGRYLSNKISISMGLQAYNVTNIQQAFYTVSGKEYGFGSTSIYTRVTSNQLYYLAVPLKFNYAINATNVIGFGINAAYLIGAKNTIEKYYLLDNEEKSTGPAALRTNGIYKGTNNTNLMLSAHYKTQFGKRIGLNLEFNYGLSDIFKNDSERKTRETPMGVRFGLTYTLFDN